MIRRPLFILFLALCAPSVFAMSDAELDSIYNQFQIEEVEVTARRREEPVIPVQKLEGARLDGLNTQSVADAARYFSGVQIKDYGGVGGMKTIDVRSMGSITVKNLRFFNLPRTMVLPVHFTLRPADLSFLPINRIMCI